LKLLEGINKNDEFNHIEQATTVGMLQFEDIISKKKVAFEQ